MIETLCDIRELSPDLLEDYLDFFDHAAFADNPEWAACYCYFPHAPHATQKWNEQAAEHNRAAGRRDRLYRLLCDCQTVSRPAHRYPSAASRV